MKLLVYISLAIYFFCYLFEGPVRWVLNMFGADSLIFIRDAVVIFPMLVVMFLTQYIRHRLHPAFIVFAIIIGIHGFITIVNIGNFFVLIYSIKVLLTVLIGALVAPYLMQPEKKIVTIIFLVWIVSILALLLDKYFVAFPWSGLAATIGDVEVDISRNWDMSGMNKRAAGLQRSSINAAVINPLISFLLIFSMRSQKARYAVMLATVFALYMTTQKAAIIAYVLTCGALIIGYTRPVALLKIAITTAFILMIALPLMLIHFDMPDEEGGVFSFGSFYMRIEHVWPKALEWIGNREAFPFGVGLGGIGGAMRFYSSYNINYADNMFVFLYAFFGIFSFAYMGWVWWQCLQVYKKPSADKVMALCIISYLLFYGSAMTMLEDQMASLFLGAAVTWIATRPKQERYEG